MSLVILIIFLIFLYISSMVQAYDERTFADANYARAKKYGNVTYGGARGKTYSTKTRREVFETREIQDGRYVIVLKDLKTAKVTEAYDFETKEPVFYRGYKTIHGEYIGGMK